MRMQLLLAFPRGMSVKEQFLNLIKAEAFIQTNLNTFLIYIDDLHYSVNRMLGNSPSMV